MTPALFAGLFFHFMLLSLIAIGGFMATLPGMYSYLVDTAGLLTPETFAKTVAFGLPARPECTGRGCARLGGGRSFRCAWPPSAAHPFPFR